MRNTVGPIFGVVIAWAVGVSLATYLGALMVEYIVGFVFAKTIPFWLALLVSLFSSPLLLAGWIIALVLNAVGVHSPLVHT